MATRDILVLNTTASRAETQQGSDTVRIKGGGEILSIENSSASSILTVQSSGSQTTLEGKITSTGNLTGVITGSFGKVEGTTLIGSAFELTNTDLEGTLSASSQIASYVTGSFRDGFEFTGTISGSGGSTGSFDRIVATTLVGDANNLTRTPLDNTISGSAQIADNISGSFNKGFEFTGTISGSATSTGSFGKMVATTLVGSAANLTNTTKEGTISSSAQIAADVSASFNKGFEFDGEISASISGSASFTTLTAHTLVGDGSALTNTISTGTVTGSAQLASDISGSFNKGFEVAGNISGSSTSSGSFGKVIAGEFAGSGANITNLPIATGVVSGSAQLASNISASFQGGFEFSSGNISGSSKSTGSFGRLVATTFTGDGSGLTNTDKEGTISSSAQLASDISGSWNMGFQYKQLLHTQVGTWSAGGNLNTARTETSGFGTKAGMIVTAGTSPAAPSTNAPVYGYVGCVESYDGSSWSEVNNINTTREAMMSAGTPTAGIIYGGGTYPNGAVSCTEEWNGTNWSEVTNMNENRKNSGDAGDTSEAVLQFGGEYASPAHYTETAEEYNGTNWSEIGDMNLGRTNLAGLGNSEAALAIGGNPNPGGHAPGNAFDVEEWDGSSWTSITQTLTQDSETYHNRGGNGAGTVNDAHIFGGFYQYYRNPLVPSYIYCYDARSQHYDGTTWSYGGRLISGRYDGGGNGTSGANGIFAGGQNPSNPTGTTNTEEYNSFYATASFGTVIANCLSGNASQLDNVNFPAGTITSSAQVADNISGSFNKGFEYTGEIRTAKGVYSTGGALNNARYAGVAAGTQDAMLATGGRYPGTPGYSIHGLSEEYDGSTWSETNDMITARDGAAQSIGIQNAALIATGNNETCTEEYNGTNYATAGSVNKGRNRASGAGTQNAGLAAGGYSPTHAGELTCTELYDGAAWSNTTALNTAGGYHAGGGSQNSAIAVGRYHSGSPADNGLNCTEIWNGSSWTEVASQVGPTKYGAAASGTVNAATKAGGAAPPSSPSGTATTERWDGTSWSVDSDMPLALKTNVAGTSSPSAFMTFGSEGANGACTFEYHDYYTTGSFGRVEADDVQIAQNSQLVVTSSLQLPVFASNSGIVSSSAGQMWFNSTTRKLNFTMDVNSWSVGGAMNTARSYVGGAGSKNAAIVVGGDASGEKGETELYNGSTWSESGDLDVVRWGLAATGTQTSALAFGGYDSPATTYAKTEEFNTDTWTEVADMNNARVFHAGIGTQNAALASAGYTNVSEADRDDTEEWNGSAWTNVADNNTGRRKVTGTGTQNAGMIMGGNVAPHTATNACTDTELYDGTSWSEVNDLITGVGLAASSGTTNAGLVFGGLAGHPAATYRDITQEWNGTSWSLGNTMSVNRGQLGGAGSQASALAFAGKNSGVCACTEEYSVSHLKTVEIDGV